MDNLTHSLVGALLGQMGLKRKTGFAMPTLIIAANIPDIDVLALALGGHQHLAIRRGITHGPIAMVLLPLVLWAAMLAWDRWRPNGKRLPVHKGWLLALAYIGTISHPALDWLNSYGVRLLEPFSSQWFYGDTIFIIDIWIWAALIIGVWMSRRREKRGKANWKRPAWIGFTAICAYIFANGLITERAERMTAEKIEVQTGEKPTLVVANAVPVQFWKRDVQWRNATNYGYGWFAMPKDVLVSNQIRSHNMNSPEVKRFTDDNPFPDVSAFLFWARMPIGSLDDTVLTLQDQRFMDAGVRNSFTVKAEFYE